MSQGESTRVSAVYFFIFSIVIRWFYNAFVWFHHGFSGTQKVVLHLLLAAASVILGWMALQLFKKSRPSGSNLGCLFMSFLYLNVLGGIGAFFFALVQFFAQQGGSETLWLL
ncbi:MAG: hypothetical protein HY064_11175 [Bacteroidetes bacterium]|nr:hypothetical protein [Bacteroidota bacterium]